MWSELAQRIQEVNKANGFDPPSWENLPIKLMLVVTEVAEAWEAVGPRPTGDLGEEMADITIRLLDVLESLAPNAWTQRTAVKAVRQGVYAPIETILWPIVRQVSQATEYWRADNKIDALICVELALAETRRIAYTLRFDLKAEVTKKVEKNATRGYLHGKVKSVG